MTTIANELTSTIEAFVTEIMEAGAPDLVRDAIADAIGSVDVSELADAVGECKERCDDIGNEIENEVEKCVDYSMRNCDYVEESDVECTIENYGYADSDDLMSIERDLTQRIVESESEIEELRGTVSAMRSRMLQSRRSLHAGTLSTRCHRAATRARAVARRVSFAGVC